MQTLVKFFWVSMCVFVLLWAHKIRQYEIQSRMQYKVRSRCMYYTRHQVCNNDIHVSARKKKDKGNRVVAFFPDFTFLPFPSQNLVLLGAQRLAVNLDPSNIVYSEKLLKLLQRVVDSRELLIQFEDAARALLEAGNREAVGLLGINLAESMERTRTDVDPAVQEMLLRHSIHAFPEHPIAVVSLGYRLEQRGEELQAMELYSEGIARDPDRLDLQLLLASSCSPFLGDADQGEMRYEVRVRRVTKHIPADQTY